MPRKLFGNYPTIWVWAVPHAGTRHKYHSSMKMRKRKNARERDGDREEYDHRDIAKVASEKRSQQAMR